MCDFNIYGPNSDQEKEGFLEILDNSVRKHSENNNILVAGDFNMLLHNQLDLITGKPHDAVIVQKFNDFLCSADLFDVWRMYHGDRKEFTWSSSYSPWVARRLDYILINATTFDKVISCDISPAPNSDHQGVELEIKTDAINRGPSYWKFNQSLLKDSDYIDLINSKIEFCKTALVGFPAHIRWDYCKSQIKECSISYSRHKATLKRNEIALLRASLKNLQSRLANTPKSDDTLLNEMKDTKLALDLYSLHQAKGAQTRARIKWVQEGEKNTKYFLGLEKTNHSNKTMTSVRNSQGKVCNTLEGIMNTQVEYYKALYSEKNDFITKKPQYQAFCEDIDISKLSEEQRDTCEGLVTLDEAANALKFMRNDSSPGTDGLTAAFYKFFWGKIGNLVIESYNESFNSGHMSTSQKRAIITLIHKGKELPRDCLGNWRPISLTNTDYKILAKALAFRLQGVIPHLVHEDQVGYIKGRNISTIIRIIDDVIEYIEVSNKTGAIVAIDYAKAFDTINKKFLVEIFNLHGFGNDFVHWVKTITTDTESCMSHCGWLSEFFPVNSGIRQGCPFSPLAFILAVELLANKIRQSDKIKGIELPSHGNTIQVIKMVLYADDNTLLMRDSNDVINALAIIDEFAEFSGLYMNKNKTE